MRLTFAPMTPAVAEQIAGWTYPPPYDVYNVGPDRRAEAIAELLDPAHAYRAISDADTGDLIGFCCFGASAQVPGGSYDEPALDVGIGLRPDLTGRRLGPTVIAAILEFANAVANATTFRATIAAFNARSQRAFGKVGFEKIGEFTNEGPKGRRDWVIMFRPGAL